MGNINSTSAYTSRQNTIATNVMSLVDFGFTQEEVDRAAALYLFVNSQSIRIDWSGNSPSITVGAIVGSGFELVGNDEIQKLKMIQNAALSAEVFIILEK